MESTPPAPLSALYAAPEADDDWADCRSRVVLYHVARARTFFAGVLRRRPAAAADRRRSAGDVLAELTAAAATTSDGRVGRFWYHACTGTFFALKKHYKAMRVECNQEGPCYPIWLDNVFLPYDAFRSIDRKRWCRPDEQ
ncbi:hypothetical protein OsI_26873 [Oryza sativa Indica Group]|uniref:Uncharacterized protein n=1 Tax=Oryza sativa subsp. indica TaxID=39946 RepID=B8B8K6_ORYSI|nr:hypothetical protein OsI_26873 [Oryza sativa Indica Group]